MIPKRLAGIAIALAACLVQAAGVNAGTANAIRVSVPGAAEVDQATAIELRLPATAAAIDGRLLFDKDALEFIGIAPASGTALSPADIDGGAAFAAYGLKAGRGGNAMHLVVVPHSSGQIQVRVVIDALATNRGIRQQPSVSESVVTIHAGSGPLFAAPQVTTRQMPVRAASPTRTLVGLRQVARQDLDQAAAAWSESRLNGAVCGVSIDGSADANNDGCIDVVDVEAVEASLGAPAAINPSVPMVAEPAAPLASSVSSSAQSTRLAAAVAYTKTFTVNYATDTVDAQPGDGVCADSAGRCSLRAAIQETNWSPGPDLIQFNINASAPVRINIGSALPLLNDTSGGVTIDAYSQPGSQVNTAQYGSNAVPGIELVGTGSNPRTFFFYMTSAGNTVRGFALNTVYHPVVINGTGAHDNYVIGNWIGMTGSGAVASYNSNIGVYLDTGPTNNHIGTPDLADRNVIGRSTKGIDHYGPGTNNNVIQNNDFCMSPSGAAATCSTAIDHDFGPKGTQIGGFGPNERNVMGPTLLNGVEISHGWDPDKLDFSTKWVNMNIHVEGNWIGFRMDGSYSANYRSGLNDPGNADNGNAVNIYDGCTNNVVDGNWLASAYDGVNTMVSNCFANIIRNNVIGVSPLGQAAPMNWWGVHVRQGTYDTIVENNSISNATLGGIGLTSGNERRIRITRNLVFNTSGPAIRLQPVSGSAAPGANTLYAAPVITSASTVAVSGTGIAGSAVEVYRASRNAGQSGLPSQFLGTGTVDSSGNWTIPVTVAASDNVSALEIAPNGNTSELGRNVTATFAAPPPAPVASFSWGQEAANRTVDFTDTSTNTPTSWSWDFGDGTTSSTKNPSHAYASSGSYNVTLTATNGGGSSSATQSVMVNDPAPGTIYAADSFSRTASSSWGSADAGGSYAIPNGPANFNVASGVGTVVVPLADRLRAALLGGVSATDVDIVFRVSVDKVPADGAYWVYAVARQTGTNEYRPKIRMLPDGRIAVQASRVISNSESPLAAQVIVPGLMSAVNGFIWVHAQVVGTGTTTISVNAWADGQSEPSGWQFTATDTTAQLQAAGSVGLRVYLGGSVSTAPVTFAFDDYVVSDPN